jgi:SAM-dependent methyltransferase
MHNSSYIYSGEELEIFEEAVNWKKYLASKIKPFVNGKVLEVGAGLGDTTRYLIHPNIESWLCLEPDNRLYLQLKKNIQNIKPGNVTAREGNIEILEQDEKFDTILYIDVLEHIEDDRDEVKRAAAHLREGGRIVVLSPAYQFLYSPFDQAIGHYRRYSKKTIRKAIDFPFLHEEKLFFLESAGLILLLLNKFILKKKYPNKKHVLIWQKVFIPISRIVDKLLFYSAGKSIIGIWKYRL